MRGMLVRHYRGSVYVVEGLANEVKTLEPVVLYRSVVPATGARVADYQLWSRKLSDFTSRVKPDGDHVEVPRFELVVPDV
jgi:hypothetical protein